MNIYLLWDEDGHLVGVFASEVTAKKFAQRREDEYHGEDLPVALKWETFYDEQWGRGTLRFRLEPTKLQVGEDDCLCQDVDLDGICSKCGTKHS